MAAVVHGTTYGLLFLLITQSPLTLSVIVVTHIVLDRYRAAKYLVWARNLLAPASRRVKWADVRANQGSPVTVRCVDPVRRDHPAGCLLGNSQWQVDLCATIRRDHREGMP
ncbi:hypothetical protein QFZ67_000346 [Streptomyces sp. V1I1]|nr:hypothetical protein [Streptomyces sp. V1I1]